MIRVTIVEENEFLRSGLELAIKRERDLEIVADFGTASPAIAHVVEGKPHVVLMSVSTPDMSGFSACVRILDSAPNTRVIMMSPELSHQSVIASMLSCAASCLPKDAPRDDLIRTVRTNGRGDMYFIRPVAEIALRVWQHNRKVINLDLLSGRDRQIVALIGDGLSNAEIAERLELSPNTVRNYIGDIFKKLKLASRAELGALAVAFGAMDDDATD